MDLTVFDDNGRATKVVHVITAKQTFVFINGGPDGNRMDDDEIAFLRELPLTPF